MLSTELSSFDLAVVICIGEPFIDHSLVPPSRRISMKFASSNDGLFLESSFKSLLKLSQIPYALSKIRKNLKEEELCYNYISKKEDSYLFFSVKMRKNGKNEKKHFLSKLLEQSIMQNYRCNAGTHKFFLVISGPIRTANT